MDARSTHYEELLTGHIIEAASRILKEPNGCLHYPFVNPGSVYEGNLWDWDSFWAVYGLLNLAKKIERQHAGFDRKLDTYLVYAKGNVQNFFDHQLDDGYIPMMITTKDRKEPYLNTKHKEGVIMNMHKPFLCQQIDLISTYGCDFSWVEEYYDNIERYFTCYDSYYFNDNCGLYVWADDIMIGMDNDPASFGRPRFSTASMFLNGFMVAELRAMAHLSGELSRTHRVDHYLGKADTLVQHIQEECWDPRDRFFYSVDVDVKTRQFDWFHKGLGVFWKTLPIKIRTWTGFIPLWAGFATKIQAAYMYSLHITDKNSFSSPYGITSLAMDEKMFNVTPTINPSNWLGPIWVIVNYIVFKGLMNFGYSDEAAKLCAKTLHLLGADLEKTGTLHEYYEPMTGQPVMNGGFINWNILALNMADELRSVVHHQN